MVGFSRRKNRSILSTTVLAGLFLFGIGGCGSGLSSLEGTVLVDGKPAPEGISLSFQPTSTGGSPSYATTDAGGHYTAAFTFQKDGIQPGEHVVKLVPGQSAGSSRMPVIGPDGQPVASESTSPPKFPREYYQEITKITVNSGSNKIDIELKTTPATAAPKK